MDRNEVDLYLDAPDRAVVERKNALLKWFNYEATREERHGILKELLGHCPENISITPLFYCDYGSNIFIGEHFYSNYNLTILDCGKVTIGEWVYIAPNVGLYAVGHPIWSGYRRKQLEYKAPITIGDDVWIGGHAVVNPGVTIGSDVVIGSGSVVTHDIPSGVVAAGNPARVLRKISDRDREYYFKDFKVPF